MGIIMHIGLELALTGMGTVFAFLVLLIYVTTFMSQIVHRFEKSRSKVTESNTQKPVAAPGHTEQARISPELLTAVVTSAIHKHRSRNRD